MNVIWYIPLSYDFHMIPDFGTLSRIAVININAVNVDLTVTISTQITDLHSVAKVILLLQRQQ